MTSKPLDAQSIRSAAKTLVVADSALDRVFQQHGTPPLWKRPASFATFVRIILEQQVSLASAKSTFTKLKIACNGKVNAAAIKHLDMDGLRNVGFSRQKTRYTLALADDVMERRFKIGSLRHHDDQEVRLLITKRLGLGDWSADVFLMMALCRPDVLPVGDLGLIKGMTELDGGDYDTSEKLIKRAEAWRSLPKRCLPDGLAVVSGQPQANGTQLESSPARAGRDPSRRYLIAAGQNSATLANSSNQEARLTQSARRRQGQNLGGF